MNDIRVKRDEVLAIIKANRDEHRAVFEEAFEGYRTRYVEEVERQLADIRAGHKIAVAVALRAPEDHTKDYDRVIRMMELSVNDELELEEADFAQYVMNQWSWMPAFTQSVYQYAAARGSDATNAFLAKNG